MVRHVGHILSQQVQKHNDLGTLLATKPSGEARYSAGLDLLILFAPLRSATPASRSRVEGSAGTSISRAQTVGTENKGDPAALLSKHDEFYGLTDYCRLFPLMTADPE